MCIRDRGTGDTDDGTGRHRYFAAGETLSEDTIETGERAYRGTDDDSDGLFGYDEPDLAAHPGLTDPVTAANATLPPVYREANSFSQWKSVVPFSNDKSTTDPVLGCMKFNMSGSSDEHMHGQITLWDKYTNSAPNDTNIYGIAPFAKMTEQTKYDTLRVPAGATQQGIQARKELYSGTQGTVKGTPCTISLWAKPEITACTTEQAVYDNVPVGLYVFGSYKVRYLSLIHI